jgi:hypothetical protein
MKTVANWKKYRDAMQAEQMKWPAAEKKVKDAEALGTLTVQQWKNISQAHTLPASPDPNGIDLTIDGWRLAWEMPNFRNRLQAMLNQQVKVGGVKVVQGPVIPLPNLDGDKIISSYFHYPPLNAPVLVFDLGNITVRGTYQQISDNVKAWRDMPRFLAVADGLRLNGTSPNLTGVYQVSIVGFVDLPKDPNGNPKPIFTTPAEGTRLVAAPPEGGAPAGGGKRGPKTGGGARVPGRAGGGGTQ